MADERTRREFDKHQVLSVNRQYTEVTGVQNIESFDTKEFVLQTSSGMLSIRGENLHIKALSLETGLVSIEGVVFDLTYLDDGYHGAEKGKKLLSRLFR
ncbi:sporulation protein YabP [Ferroacidibacillus organovorans]|uniref:Sporulation protein YabP n=1 Tax=Ferroacidibacillus organovorans TaxID=1765683 RepID=A0A162UQ15_9BACL|nr:sporulation protein YabP [Ferroacidibacillus organovorans]KYP81944.1 sporulation protein YabP [Ferroacidibacillus organovorans]OAG94919.1 sporulation protein YabP [Ferroacidibacillus organovorans]OPG15002.1 sporulation protein YabP [Ferroacidibacillus organovorans]